ncbi:MAG: phasin family protein [Sphingomicrobium sp.]
MTDQQTNDVTKATEISAKAADAALDSASASTKIVTESAKKIIATAAKAAPKAPRKPARKAKRTTAKRITAKAAKRVSAKRTAQRKTNTNAAAPKRVAHKRIETMTNYDYFKGFQALPTFTPFQNMFSKANENGQQFAERGQKVAQELADLARANVEAVVEAGRVATEGTRALTQDAVSSGREGFEKAADAIRALAEAKSPSEYLQLQGEIARASFDRMVAEGSKITESMVKLAGEAFQPISNRASANAERFNTLVA